MDNLTVLLRQTFATFYDCLWEGNDAIALMYWYNIYSPTAQSGEVVRCVFRNNGGSNTAWPGVGGVVVLGGGGFVSITDSVFDSNVGASDYYGAALSVISGSSTTIRNVTMISNFAAMGGAALSLTTTTASATLIDCFLHGNEGEDGAHVRATEGQLTMINSTIAEGWGSGGAAALYLNEGVTFVGQGLIIRDVHCRAEQVRVYNGAFATFIDCIFERNQANIGAAVLQAEAGTAYFLRTTFRDNYNNAYNIPGCFAIYSSSHVKMEDCDIVHCYTTNSGNIGMALLDGGDFEIVNSRISDMYSSGHGSIAEVKSGSRLQISATTISNASGTKFAINDISGADFAVQLDTVVVDSTVGIWSSGKVLMQNVVGFSDDAVKNASLATCSSTGEFCIADSCTDDSATIGTQCICTVDGVEQPFPVGCMQVRVSGYSGFIWPASMLQLTRCVPTVCCDRCPCPVDSYAHLSHCKISERVCRARPRKRA